MKFRHISLKLKINLVLGVLLLSILICWGSFYSRANSAVTQNAEVRPDRVLCKVA